MDKTLFVEVGIRDFELKDKCLDASANDLSGSIGSDLINLLGFPLLNYVEIDYKETIPLIGVLVRFTLGKEFYDFTTALMLNDKLKRTGIGIELAGEAVLDICKRAKVQSLYDFDCIQALNPYNPTGLPLDT